MVINVDFILLITRVILLLSIPFSFLISPYLTVGIIILLCLIYKKIFNRQHESSFGFIFLFLTLFSGIAVIGVRLYDWLIILGLVDLILTNRHLELKAEIPCFFFMVLLVFALNYHDYSYLAVVRYILALTLLFILYNKQNIFPKDKTIFYDIIFSAIYFAIAIFIFTSIGILGNSENGFINTNIYLFNDVKAFSGEIRLNGFFSDPNKYMSYMFILTFLIEQYWGKRDKKYPIFLCALGAILSLSRTAVLVLIIFLVGRKLLIQRKYSSLLNLSMIVVIICSIFALALFPNEINQLSNDFFNFTGEILGREQSMKQASSLDSDNRILIWQKAWQIIQDSPLIGNGWLSERILLPYPTHNTALCLLLDGGIIILISYIGLFHRLFFNRKWPVIFPLIIVPLLVLDLTDYRMEFLVLGVLWWFDKFKNASSDNSMQTFNREEKV